MLTRSFPRFLLQAGLLIAVAAVAAVLHLGAVPIVLAMAGAFAVVVFAEWALTRGGAGPPAEEPQPAREGPREPQPLPRRPGPDRSRSRGAPLLRPPGTEPVARPLYLREFGNVAGDLSEDFDTFVRESFPDLIATR